MRQLSRDEIQILQHHAAWLRGDEDGVKADLSGANLYEADLYKADLCGADLCGADLREADLREADLREADLYKADLCGANLYGADLCEANLCRANLRGANLYGAKGIMLFGPIGSRSDFTYAVRGRDTMIRCGCFWGTLDAWEAQCRAVHGDTPHGRAYAAAAEFIRAYAAAYWTEDGI